MYYYLSLPPSFLSSFANDNGCIKPPQNTRLQQFPCGKQLNFTCVCHKLPKKTLWRKFPGGGFPLSGPWTITGITESWANKDIADAELGLAGYIIFRRDRIGRRGGGVTLYIKESI